jgi:DNA repair protein RecO (recombination protein O)
MGERLYRSQGVIIKRVDVGEADRVLTILTPDGKIEATARGVRKTSSKLAGHLELLSVCQLQLAHGRSRDVITQSVAINRFAPLQTSLLRMAAGYYVAELADVLVGDEDAASPTFVALTEALQALCTASQIDMVVHWYTLALCDAIGYRPQLIECAVCGNMLDQQADRWSHGQGGMLCADCYRSDPHAQSIPLALFKLLRFVQREPVTQVMHVVQPGVVHTQAYQLMRHWIRRVHDRPLRAADFFDDVRRQHAN